MSHVTWKQGIIDEILKDEIFEDEVDLLWDTFPSGQLKWCHVLTVHKELETSLQPSVVKAALEQCGFKVEGQRKERKGRMVSSNPHTRWQDCPSHGGTGTAFGVWTGAGNASHTPG